MCPDTRTTISVQGMNDVYKTAALKSYCIQENVIGLSLGKVEDLFSFFKLWQWPVCSLSQIYTCDTTRCNSKNKIMQACMSALK